MNWYDNLQKRLGYLWKLVVDLQVNAGSEERPHYRKPGHDLDGLAAQRRAHLAATVEQAVELLHAELPDWHVAQPAGGSVLWPELPLADTRAYALLARRHGVHVTPGSVATSSRDPSAHVRICVDRPRPLVEEGIRRLGLAWRELHTARHPALG